MTFEEIRETWEAFHGREAFEIFDANNVDNSDVEIAVDAEVAQEYSHWIYCNLK